MAAKKGRIHHRPPQKTWLGGGWHINFGGRTGMQGESHDAGGRSMSVIPYRAWYVYTCTAARSHCFLLLFAGDTLTYRLLVSLFT